jgi:hypothetical protein
MTGDGLILVLAQEVEELRAALAPFAEERERNIAEAVRTGIPGGPSEVPYSLECVACGKGPCRGGARVNYRFAQVFAFLSCQFRSTGAAAASE